MRKIFVIVFLLSFVAACNVSTQGLSTAPNNPDEINGPTESSLDSAGYSPTTQTALPNLTAVPRTDATQTPSETAALEPTPPGLLTHQELEQRVNDWKNGEIKFSDSDRLLDEKTGEEVKLGVLYSGPIDSVIFVFYSLGFTLIEDQDGTPYLINAVGFEDAKGVRFTSVFHNGRLLDQDVTIRLLQWQGRRINYGEKISSEFLSPERFAEITINLPLSVYLGVTYTDGSTGHDDWNSYLTVSKDATKTLTSFLLCNECFVEDMPSLLEPITNTIPTEYNSNIPYLPIYTVSYW